MKASHFAALFCFGLAGSTAVGCSPDAAPINNTGGGGASSATVTSTPTSTINSTATTPTSTVATSTVATSTVNTATVATNATATTGTTGTTGGAGGATATTATATTGTSACAATAAATGPVAINPNNGWVNCDTNTVGIQGAFFTFSDGLTSTITPANFEASGTEVCVTGEVGQVVDMNYDVYGAGVGFNFADESPWDAAAQGITGVSFNISALPDVAMRVIFTTGAGDHCAVIAAAGPQTVSFASTMMECWDTAAAGAAPMANDIIAVKWQVTTDSTSTYPFDFCITDLAAVP